jgi:hypothetical protein
MYTAGSATLSQGEGRSWAVFPFPNDEARVVRNIFIRGAFPKDTILFATLPDGGTVTVATLGPEMTWLEQNFAAPVSAITGLYVQSATKDGVQRGYCYAGIGDCKTITVTEVAIQVEDCYEEIAFDLGSNQVITSMNVKFNNFVGGSMATSLDDANYVNRLNLMDIPSSYFVPKSVSIGNITARYVRFR